MTHLSETILPVVPTGYDNRQAMQAEFKRPEFLTGDFENLNSTAAVSDYIK